jgi:hypothetical protein
MKARPELGQSVGAINEADPLDLAYHDCDHARQHFHMVHKCRSCMRSVRT